jgi:N-acetylglucosaminyl-diphospho-decaprenol L-rhamnosyltransferase
MLSIIVIEFHSLDEIQRFYQSIQKVDIKGEVELIISSNSLYDKEEQERIRREYSFAKWTFNEKNGGFAYGINMGLKVAKGDYLLMCNPDVVVKKGISAAIDFLAEHNGVGAVGPLIMDAKGNIQDSCREYVTPFNYVVRQLKRIVSRRERITEYDSHTMQTVDWTIGAFILMTREAYNLTKGLDEGYFMYAEDLDFCTRLRIAGKEIVYFPEMEIEYKGTSSARHSWKYAKIFLESHLRYWRRFGFTLHRGGYKKKVDINMLR